MKNIKIFLISLAGCILINIYGQEESFSLSLEEARQYALQHNKTMINVKNNLSISDEKIKEARSLGLPQIEGTLDFMTYFNYELELDFGFGTTTTPDINYTVLDAGDYEILNALSQLLGPTETEPIIMDNQSSAIAQISQLLFSGQYWIGLQTAKLAKKIAEQNIEKTELDIKENVTNTYYLILITEQTLKNVRENLENLNKTLQHTDNMYKAGILEATDVDQLKIAVNQLKNLQKSMERNVTLSYSMLKFQLGVKPDANIKLSEDLFQLIDNINPENSIIHGYNIANNINYQMIETQVHISKKQVDLQKWACAPTLAGFYSYTEKILTTDFDLTPPHVAGINLTVPIFSGGMRKSKISQAKLELDNALRNQEMIKEQLELQEKQLLFNLQNATENFNTQKENVEIAERVYNSIHNKYKQGLVSSLDLTQANNNFLQAQNNYLNAVLILLQAELSLKKLYSNI